MEGELGQRLGEGTPLAFPWMVVGAGETRTWRGAGRRRSHQYGDAGGAVRTGRSLPAGPASPGKSSEGHPLRRGDSGHDPSGIPVSSAKRTSICWE